MNDLDVKLNQHFSGKVVRKDLTKHIKGNVIVPTYVLEYLLGQYCATDDEETIKEGVEKVKGIIAEHFIHRDESQLIKSTIREKGSHRIIDKVAVVLNEQLDRYEASFSNLGLKKIVIADEVIKQHQKLLSSGVWCISTLGYLSSDDRTTSPWTIETLKPIQISNIDLEEFKEGRKQFSTDEWIDILIQSLGLNPQEFSQRSKLLQLSRLIPFAENNYNLIELGPKGTGKSHIYSEMSPHGILISGGEVSKAKLFVNNANGNIGLVGYWDVVAYDEFAGRTKKVDKGLVDIMKNYMANKTFSRGTEVYGAAASMVFVGNTDHSLEYMLKHGHLFDSLPKEYMDSAFLDRIHCYLPGWEVQKLRNEMFTSSYGFIVDYLAEILKEFRKEDHTGAYRDYVSLSDSITTRDRDSISKTFSGLLKVIYPHGEYEETDVIDLLKFAIENRMRVKTQLIKMDETFEKVDFSFTIKSSGKSIEVETLETLGSKTNGSSEQESTKAQKDKIQTLEPLKEKQEIIYDNQKGVSYRKLFGDYLAGAHEITLQDPFVRLPYQLRNLMEFAELIAETKAEGEEVKLHLVTNNIEEYLENSKESFDQIQSSLEDAGIIFTYEFDDAIHDRYIQLDNGWKIVPGRGLDIFQKTNGWFDLAEHYQENRQCKACEITYLRT